MDYSTVAMVLGSDIEILTLFTVRDCLSLMLFILAGIFILGSLVEDGWFYRHLRVTKIILTCNICLFVIFVTILLLFNHFAKSNVWHWFLVGIISLWYLCNYRYHLEKVKGWNPRRKHLFSLVATLVAALIAYVLSLGCLVLPLLFAGALLSPWYFLHTHDRKRR